MPTDPVEEILPDEDEPLSADEEFGLVEENVAAQQFSDPLDPLTFDDSDPALITEEVPPFGRGWSFDFGRRGFNSIEGRGPLETRGEATLRGWIEKCLHTQKGAHAIYGDDFGISQPFELLGEGGDLLDTEEMEVEVIEALTFHPRISNVKDFQIEFDSLNEALRVAFTVVVDDEDEMELEGLLLA